MLLSCAATILAFTACSDNNSGGTDNEMDGSTTMTTSSELSTGGTGMSDAAYVDLQTGDRVTQDASGRYVDGAGNPVDFYVDINTRDTFYGHSGEVVNNALINENGNYRVDEAKLKIDGDELKYKSGDTKIKIEDDEYKRKDGDTKVKVEDDEVKIKTD